MNRRGFLRGLVAGIAARFVPAPPPLHVLPTPADSGWLTGEIGTWQGMRIIETPIAIDQLRRARVDQLELMETIKGFYDTPRVMRVVDDRGAVLIDRRALA